MTTYDWHTLRDRGIRLFNGDTPGTELERRIVDHFARHPARVATTIEATGRKVAAGGIRSGWAILLRELDAKPQTAQADDNADRAIAIRLAEAWIRNTGGYIDRQSELEAELFGDTGRLRHWPDLRQRMTAYWLEQRHRFQKAERDAHQRAQAQAALRAELRTRLRHASSSAITPELATATTELVAQDVTLRRHQEPPPIDNHTADAIARSLEPEPAHS